MTDASNQNLSSSNRRLSDVERRQFQRDAYIFREHEQGDRAYIIAKGRDNLEPQTIANYLQYLAGMFHKYYAKHRIISDNEKLSNDDVNFIEKEFNDFMLADGYENLFRFPKFKEFIKSITSEIN